MLQTCEIRPLQGGCLEGDYEDIEGWSVVPVSPSVRQLRLYLGDPDSGPLVWLFHGSGMQFPSGQARPESIPLPTHLHRTPTFRIVVGDQPRQVQFDGAWQARGEYVLLEANKVYSEPVGVDGHKLLLVFADRRGMHPANKETAGMTSEELIAWNVKGFGPFDPGLTRVHTRDDEATIGTAITTRDRLQHGGRAKGSIDDQSDWASLSDGSRIAAALMGDPARGPAVIMSRNVPGAVESPAGFCDTDTFRLIFAGSCSIGGRRYTAGSFVASAQGTPQGEVVHGPEGSTQILIVDGRHRWAPVGRAGAALTSRRLEQTSAVLAPFIGAPAHAAGLSAH